MDKKLVLNAVALGMGVAGTVLSVLGTANASVPILFGIGIFCLAVNGLKS